MNFVIIIFSLFFINESIAVCSFHTTILRQLRKEGFHLNLLSTVEIVVSSNNCPYWEDCTLALVENIGSSFYVNARDLSGTPFKVCIKDKVDVEAAEFTSKPHLVFVYSSLYRSLNLIHTDVNLPLHLRYHLPQRGGGYQLTTLTRPKLLIKCELKTNLPGREVKAPCPSCSGELCHWVELPFKTNVENLTIPVPVGDSEHLVFVTAFTYLLAFGGCIYLTLSVVNLTFFN